MNDVNREELSELLSGYLDGELDDNDVALIERVLLKDQDARNLLEELRQMVHIVQGLPRHDAPASIAEDIAAFAERSELLGDTDAFESFPGPRGRSPWSTLLSMAAGIAVVATGVLWYSYDTNTKEKGQAVVSNRKPTVDESQAFRKVLDRKSGDVALNETASSSRSVAPTAGDSDDDSSTPTKTKLKKRTSGPARKNRAKDFPEPTGAWANLPAVPVDRIHQIDPAKLFALANVEQILALDGRVSHLRDHSFPNEKWQLAIPARDGVESGEFARRLVGALRSRNVVDAALSPDETRLTEISKNGFFLQGASGVNYRDERQEQVLVYLTVSDRDALFDEIEQWSVTNEIELQVGPIRLRGLSRARDALAGKVLSGTDEIRSATADQDFKEAAIADGSSEAEETAERGFGLSGLRDMVRVLAKAGEQTVRDGDTVSEEKDRFDSSSVEPEDSVARSQQPSAVPGEPPASAAIDGQEPTEIFAEGRRESVKIEGFSASGNLVESRMMDMRAAGKGRSQEWERPGRERNGDVGLAITSTRSAEIRRNIEPEPEQFVTLVFQIIPKGLVKATVSKRPGGTPFKKTNSSNGQNRDRSKAKKKAEPIRQ